MGELERDATRTLDGTDQAPTVASRVGQRFGAYALVRHLGSGGMGSVYLARRVDGQFEQEVAIKVMKRGMDTDLILRRFQAERQILASLSHPNVCRLLDGGSSADGVPYFVMEAIDGEPIDRYCEWHALSVASRLALFVDVCEAVRYAHQNLVVHCDIKPSNILVTEAGTARLLDFGIAKLIGESSGATATGQRFLTPGYASPEQIRGELVNTATDVHALGVLLYKLLCGAHPFQRPDRSPAEVARAILEDQPPPPSQVAGRSLPGRELRGDLDTIVLRALAKDAAQRYPSAGELAADIVRHLHGQPVLARRDTVAYRAAKFIRRHRLGVAAAAAVFVALVGGMATTVWQARVAREERARAERRFEDVRRVANALVFDLYDAIADLPGSTPARKLLVERAVTFLDGLAADEQGDVTLSPDLVEAYKKLGDVQGNTMGAHLGDFSGARVSYQKGMAIAASLLARDPRDAKARLQRARLLERLADMALNLERDREGALAQYRLAIAEANVVLADHPADEDARLVVAIVNANIGDVLADLGRHAEAQASYQEALAQHRELAAAGNPSPKIPGNIPMILESLGDSMLRAGDAEAALARFREALRLQEAALARSPNSPQVRRHFAAGLAQVGNALLKTHDHAGALAYYVRSRDMDRELLASDPENAQALRDVAIDAMKLGNTYEAMANWPDASAQFREVLRVFLDMRAKGKLTRADEDVLPELEAKIAECDARVPLGPLQ